MWNFLNPENKIVQLINRTAYSVVLSILWLLLSCTVIGFGPATTALYHTTVKVLRKDAGSLFSTFFGSIRDSWKTTIPAGILTLVLILSLVVIDLPNLQGLISGNAEVSLFSGILSIIKLVVCPGIVLYMFPIFSRFQVGLARGCFLSVVIALRHLPTTLILTCITVAILLLLWPQPLLVLILPVAYWLFASLFMEKVLISHMSEEDRTPDPSKNQWYLEKDDIK